MEQITRLIEEEVEKRVNERVNKILERISQTYDISMRQLLRDLSSIEPIVQQHGPMTCLGLTAKTRGVVGRHIMTDIAKFIKIKNQSPESSLHPR